MIKRALDLLLNIHHALCFTDHSSIGREVLYNSEARRIIDTLLDLISLEGIYPNLLSGVGVPIERRVKSVLQGGLVTRSVGISENFNREGNGLLEEIVRQLGKVAADKGKGLGSALQERTLVDLIAALGQLAYASYKGTGVYNAILEKILDEYVVPFTSTSSLIGGLVHNPSIAQESHSNAEITQDTITGSLSNIDFSLTFSGSLMVSTSFISYSIYHTSATGRCPSDNHLHCQLCIKC